MPDRDDKPRDRRIREDLRSLVSRIRRASGGRLSDVAPSLVGILSIVANNQNDPEYRDDDYDVYPEDFVTEMDGDHDDDEVRHYEDADTYYGKGFPDPDFKWGRWARVRIRDVFGRPVEAEAPSEITEGLYSPIKRRAREVRITDKEYRPRLNMWIMKATSGGPTYDIKIKGVDVDGQGFRGDKFWDADVETTCGCPYWRWNGPEYHAVQDDYLKGSPRGTASPPDIRDPSRVKFVCKHMYKAFEEIRDMESKTRKRKR